MSLSRFLMLSGGSQEGRQVGVNFLPFCITSCKAFLSLAEVLLYHTELAQVRTLSMKQKTIEQADVVAGWSSSELSKSVMFKVHLSEGSLCCFHVGSSGMLLIIT